MLEISIQRVETYKMLKLILPSVCREEIGDQRAWSSNYSTGAIWEKPGGNEGRPFGSEGYFIGCLYDSGSSEYINNDAVCSTYNDYSVQ